MNILLGIVVFNYVFTTFAMVALASSFLYIIYLDIKKEA